MSKDNGDNKAKTSSKNAETPDRTITLSPNEQLRFWRALQAPVRLTTAQKQLGALTRGELGIEKGEE